MDQWVYRPSEKPLTLWACSETQTLHKPQLGMARLCYDLEGGHREGLTQFVPVGQQDGCAVQHVWQGRLDQVPARHALDRLGQRRRESVELVLHQDPLKRLGG